MRASVKFTARIGDVLGWDQHICSVLLVHDNQEARNELRTMRDATVEIVVTPLPEHPKVGGKP